MSEVLRNAERDDKEQGGATEWDELKGVPFAGFGSAERQKSGEDDVEPVSERSIAEKMLDVSSEKQDELIDYLNQINSGGGLIGDTREAYEKYLDERGLVDADSAMTEWQGSLSDELDRHIKMDECIIKGIEELERPANADKSLEEIFANLAEQAQNRINSLVQSGAWGGRLNDEQRQDHLVQRDEYRNLADWAPWVRKGLETDALDIQSEDEEAVASGIDVDSMIDGLQAELQKRQKAIEFLETKDQRDYGNQTLDAKVHLAEKQRDLHVLKMIQTFNSGQSEDETVSLETAAAAIEKYLNDRQTFFDRLTKQREQYTKGSEEYRDITKRRGKWYKEMEAARRVAEQLGLELSEDGDDGDEGELAMENEPWSDAQAETQPVKSETEFEGEQSTEQDAQEKTKPIHERTRTNSEAEVRAVREVIEAVRPDIEQLFAMSRGSFSMEQATAYLLTSNQKMGDLSAQYANMLQDGQNIGRLEAFAAGFDEEMMKNFGYSTGAINSIRQKAQTLPISLKGPMLQCCQKVENALAQVVSIVKKKDEKIHSHDTPMEKQRADEKELENVLENEMGM